MLTVKKDLVALQEGKQPRLLRGTPNLQFVGVFRGDDIDYAGHSAGDFGIEAGYFAGGYGTLHQHRIGHVRHTEFTGIGRLTAYFQVRIAPIDTLAHDHGQLSRPATVRSARSTVRRVRSIL